MRFLADFDVAGLLIQFAVLLFSLSLHEAAHAWTADRFGDSTGRRLGRVTLNPLAHVDLIGTVVFPVVQSITGLPLIGWAKPVPIQPLHLAKPRRDQVLVGLAGPGSNLLAALVSFLLLLGLKASHGHTGALITVMIHTHTIPRESSLAAPLAGILFFSLVTNLALALFNVLPIPPLDGHWVLYGFLPGRAARVLERVSPYGFIVLYVLMFRGAFQFLFSPIQSVLDLLVLV